MVTEPLLVGLDVGTTAVKAAVVRPRRPRGRAGPRARRPGGRCPTGAEVDRRRAARRRRRGRAGGGRGGRGRSGRRIGSRAWPRPACCSTRTASRSSPPSPGTTSAAATRRRASPPTCPGSRRGSGSRPARCARCQVRWMREHVPGERARRPLAQRRRVGRGSASAASRPPSCRLSSRTGFYDLHAQAAVGRRPRVGGRAPGPDAASRCRPARRWAPPSLPEAERRGADGRRPRPPAAAVGARRRRRGRRARLVRHRRGVRAGQRAAAARAAWRSAVAGGISVGWHAPEAARRCSAPTGPAPAARRARAARHRARGARARSRPRRSSWRAGLGAHARGIDGATATARAGGGLPRRARRRRPRSAPTILDHMAAVAAPAKRLVVTGGWAAGAAAQAVKERHLGAFELSPALFSGGARGSALAAGRAAGVPSTTHRGARCRR